MKNTNISKKIIKWYDNNKRILPWRTKISNKKKEYYTLVSEFMLQQTQVKTVIPYFNNFILKIPDIESLSKIRNEKLMKCWEGLGYYSRAKNLKKTAKKILKEFKGRLPNNEDDLKSLPGIGDYTSKAIMAIAFNKKIIPLDGNVERILKRVLYLKKNHEISKENLHRNKLFFGESKRAGDYAQAIMEIGALICKPINPICSNCPISLNCISFKKKDFKLAKINKFNKQKFFEVNIIKNKFEKYYLLRNHKFNFLKGMPILPMKEITQLKYENYLGKKVNIKMSNMDMKIIFNETKLVKDKNGLYVGNNELSSITLPTFTKKLLNTALRN